MYFFLSSLKINNVIQQTKTRGHVDHPHWVPMYTFLKLYFVFIHYEMFHTLCIFYLFLKVIKVLILGTSILSDFIHFHERFRKHN